jgi:benzoyl-CoA reductase subunit B
METEIYNKYKNLGKGNWGKDLIMWKAMYTGFLNQSKEEEFNPFIEFFLNVFLDLPKARKEKKHIIMHPFNYGPELFHAMDLAPLMQEIFSVGLAPFHMNEPYIDFTNKIGYGDNPTLCNAQRPLIGTYMQGAAPNPDLLFFLSTPCNSLAMTYQVFHNLTGIPMFNMDIPYWAYDRASKFYDGEIMDYMIKQIKDLIFWLEKITNKQLDILKLQNTMKLVNQAREYILEFNELLKTVPSPVNSITGFGNFIAMVTRGGHIDSVNLTKFLRDLAAENVKNGIAGVPDEKIRIAWPYTHVFFDRDLFPWLEETFHANVIMDILGYYQIPPHDTSTIEKCYESLAMGTLDFSMIGTCRGPIEYYIDYVLKYIKDYKIDAVIMPMQFACKHAYSMARVTSEAIREELGTPTLIFGCDPYDSREVTSEAIRERISVFLKQVVL